MSYVEQLRRQKQLEHYQENDPWGKETADKIEAFGTSVVEGAIDWWKRESADQEGIRDDALRSIAGGVKNVANYWEEARTVDNWWNPFELIEAGAARTVETGLKIAGAGGYYGGKLGGAAAEGLGIDRRLGAWGVGFAGDMLAGYGAGKAFNIARTTTNYVRLSPFQRALQYGSTSGAMASELAHTGIGLKKGLTEGARRAFDRRILKAGRAKLQYGVEPDQARVNLPKDQLPNIRDDITGWVKKEIDFLESQGLTGSKLEKALKKATKENWTDQGIHFDGVEYRVGDGSLKDLVNKVPDAKVEIKSQQGNKLRALASDPTKDPQVQELFKIWDETGAIDPEFNLEEYGKYIRTGASWEDRVTVAMAKHFGGAKAKGTAVSDWVMKPGALDKEHARSLANKGSNDFLAQFFGSRMLNRSQGKFDSFTSEVMEILGAPTSKRTATNSSKNPWNANLESASNWAATQMQRKHGLKTTTTWGRNPYYNPVEELMPSDWLRIQQAFAKVPPGASRHMQEEVAMKVLREREILNAWHKVDLERKLKIPKADAHAAMVAYLEKIWEIDVPKSRKLIDRIVGEQVLKRVLKERFNILPFKDKAGKLHPGQGRRVPNQLVRGVEGLSIAKPGAKLSKETGRIASKVEARGLPSTPSKQRFIDLGRDELKIIPLNEKDQMFEFVESTLERLEKGEELNRTFGWPADDARRFNPPSPRDLEQGI